MEDFVTLKSDFEERVKEVNLFFDVVAAEENVELTVVKGIATQVLTVGPMPADWARMMKATGYLVIYNLVEAFVRRGFQAVFDAIKNDSLSVGDLIVEIRKQWTIQRNRAIKTYDGSPKLYMDLSHDIVEEIVTKQVAHLSREKLPFSGNIDADVIRKTCFKHGVPFQSSAPAKGGSQLEIVKVKRNALSHGDESFEECGRHATAQEMIDIKTETVQFMRDLLASLEKFSTTKAYRITAPTPSVSTAVP
ncbi:MAG: MAE_28990/MAE_18760 family HEPN-like nuclease [Planctomycetota bacterium]|nr:MAE_28990/MAE_18760 family HEPN-like nuclease [Planctomycetota bacterium]